MRDETRSRQSLDFLLESDIIYSTAVRPQKGEWKGESKRKLCFAIRKGAMKVNAPTIPRFAFIGFLNEVEVE